ncbi:MAG: hypothetical protein ABI321_08340 [Polyangia bacterium]
MDACPKCGSTRVSGGACAACGLRVDLWARFDGRPTPDPLLDPAFAELRASWTDPAAHERFASVARRAELLDAAAARYRQVLRETPDDSDAHAALGKLALLASTQQQVAVRFSDTTLKTLRVLSTIVAATVALTVGYILFAMLRR